MGWERRGNHPYYYKSRFVNGRSVKIYCGRQGSISAEVAATVAKLVEEYRATATTRRRELADLVRQVNAYGGLAYWVVWTARVIRRKGVAVVEPLDRDKPMKDTMMDNELDLAAEVPMTQKAFEDLVDRANRGCPASVTEVRRLIDAHAVLRQTLAGMTRLLIAMMASRLSRGRVEVEHAVKRQAEVTREELHAACESPLERLVADRVVVDGLMAQLIDLEVCMAEKPTVNLQRFRTRVHRNLKESIKILTKMRNGRK